MKIFGGGGSRKKEKHLPVTIEKGISFIFNLDRTNN